MKLAARRARLLHDGFELSGVERDYVNGSSGPIEIVQLGHGEPLVLVPGLAGGWGILAPLARSLSARHRLILIGMPSDRGFPSGPNFETPVRHATALALVLDSLGLERPDVLGLSFGGAVALELGLRYPGRVGRLALMGVEATFGGTQATNFARGVLERFPLPFDSPFVNQFFGLLQGGRPAPSELNAFIIEHWWRTDQGVMASRLRALEEFDVADRLWQLDVPTLVVAGSRDVIVGPDQQRSLADAIPGAQFEAIMGAGHLGYLTHREELSHILGRWMRVRAGSVR